MQTMQVTHCRFGSDVYARLPQFDFDDPQQGQGRNTGKKVTSDFAMYPDVFPKYSKSPASTPPFTGGYRRLPSVFRCRATSRTTACGNTVFTASLIIFSISSAKRPEAGRLSPTLATGPAWLQSGTANLWIPLWGLSPTVGLMMGTSLTRRSMRAMPGRDDLRCRQFLHGPDRAYGRESHDRQAYVQRVFGPGGAGPACARDGTGKN